jgi:DNA-binding response OmpR family regulator
MTHVLIVEDDPAAAELLALVMQRAGYELTVVGTAAEALQSVTRGVQLVLLDLGLPDMDGLQVCRELRAARPALPVLVISARSSEPDLVLALDAGADDYLVKPFRSQELLARASALLRRSHASDLTFVGDLAIDSSKFLATVNGSALKLTPKEFEILAILAQRTGLVVERDYLLRTLWRNALPAHSKSLDMHLSSLRRKLQQAQSSARISTERAIGFRLLAQ